MKIVASTRLNKAQKAMQNSREFKKGENEFIKNIEPKESNEKKTLLIVISSDKGLCGSIHSQIGKFARKRIDNLKKNVDVVTVGEKVKNQILRAYPENLKLTFSGVCKEAPTFEEASLIADHLLDLGDYGNIEVLYNKYISGISFEPCILKIYLPSQIENAPKKYKYEYEPENENLNDNLSHFFLISSLMHAMSEGYISETLARRNAMDNASKNANEMIEKYSILYNRTRQAVITNELVDIITGASSLE